MPGIDMWISGIDVWMSGINVLMSGIDVLMSSIQAVRKVDVINETLKSTHNSKQKTCSNHRSNP